MSLRFLTRLSYLFLLFALVSAYLAAGRPLAVPTTESVPSGHIVFQVSPPDAQISVKAKVGSPDPDSLLGYANQPISKAQLQALGEKFTLLFSKDGYEPTSRDFSENKLQLLLAADVYPKVPITLNPDSKIAVFKTRLQTRWKWAVASLLCLTAFLLLFFKQDTVITLAQGLINIRAGKDKFLGTTVKGYRLTKHIDEGAWGSVYQAVPEEFVGTPNANNHRVAIKVFALRGDLDNPSNRARFSSEGVALKGIEHPNIVKLIDAGDMEDESSKSGLRPYIIFEYISGKPLSDLTHKTKKVTIDELEYERRTYYSFPIEKIIALLSPIVEALQFTHDKDLIHRDIKPGNIKVNDEGRPILLDFGLARISKSTLTATGFAVGTPLYASPEMNRGLRGIDHRADQFSFGVMLYHMLAGYHPFGDDDIKALQRILALQEPPLPLKGKPYFNDQLDAVFKKMLAFEAEDRFDSITEAFEAFKKALKV